jgi:NADPH:quinone reductase-like Zn-dependent oxidoreductase
VQAAAVSVSALTALEAVRDHGHVPAGQKVLVIGASGGVGTFAVRIAKTYGAEVTGGCSTTKMDLVQSIGADHVIDYTRAGIADGALRYDAIIDTGGNRPLRQLGGALTPRGTLVIVGGETGGRWLGGFDRGLRAPVLSRVRRSAAGHGHVLGKRGRPVSWLLLTVLETCTSKPGPWTAASENTYRGTHRRPGRGPHGGGPRLPGCAIDPAPPANGPAGVCLRA